MQIFFVASEVTPIAKVGGLGDVIGALPKALYKLGVKVSIITGYYGTHDENKYPTKILFKSKLFWGVNDIIYTVRQGVLPGSRVKVYFIDQPEIIGSGSVYDSRTALANNQSEIERFLFLCKAAVFLPGFIGIKNDIWHLHDWHAAALVEFLSPDSAPTLLTIHNLANQGWATQDTLAKAGILTQKQEINIFRLGLEKATWLSTVSPTYAQEIQKSPEGEGLEEVIKARRHELTGIVNGVDIDFFNPVTDKFLADKLKSNLDDFKNSNKQALFKFINLPQSSVPLFGIVSRLTSQKGIDLIVNGLEPYLQQGSLRFVFLGMGDPALEKALKNLAVSYPRAVAGKIGFDEKLAHLIYAASDFFLMPSRFEPCGLGQLIAMRYGSVPIVRSTGGLKDTVIDIEFNKGNGLVFFDYKPEALGQAIIRALDLYNNRGKLEIVRQSARQRDSSWLTSAKEYYNLYKSLCILKNQN